MKKRMMKTAALAMAAVMMMSMTACAKKEDPKALFDSAVKKNSELKDMDMTTNMAITMSQGDQKQDITMKMDMKMSGLDTDKMQYLSDGTMSVMGQSVPIKTFYTDGYSYTDSMGQKVKYKMDMKQMMDTIKQSTNSVNLTSADLKTVTMKKDGDNTILSYTVDPDKINGLVEEMMNSLGSAGSALEGMKMDIKDASGEYTVNKDGYYTTMSLKMNMDMTMQGQTINMSMEVDGTVNNPGQPVEFTLPSTDGYQEIENPNPVTGTEAPESGAAAESTAA